ncbi:putative lipoprotein [Marinobacterium lacunae]|uniref:Putative lipoprotein n=1 Tax=Marinobacterium lacunae TaxID=1232683 RepID=A0A081G199_9GAMM|nr:ChaN family lipoprotein [Marinobacterium lacunae]KEA64554.1 putative lipoprotein [Marinobacterium lacunae]
MRRAFITLLLVIVPLSAGAAKDNAHPLVGKLWSTAEQRFVDWSEFYQHWLPKGGWLLLGEQHDNADHHRLEALIIREMGTRKQLGAVALEMATLQQQPAFDKAQAQGASEITAEQLDWSEGWPWSLYAEPVRTAFHWSPKVLGADIARERIKTIYRGKETVDVLEPAHTAFMLDLLFDSHCGQMPKDRLQPMQQIQLARDQQIASVLRTHTQPGLTGVLLTGTIHARSDLGVPRWLGTTPRVSLLMQALEQSQSPEDYHPATFGNLPTTDLILFTPETEAADYCADLTLKSK